MRGYGEINPSSKCHQCLQISSYIQADGTALRGSASPPLPTECSSCPLALEMENPQWGAFRPIRIFVLWNPQSLWLQEGTGRGPHWGEGVWSDCPSQGLQPAK